MPSREHVIAVFREWIVKAENDLKTAVFTLRMGAECPTDTVCFHAQQCVEKYLKAVLVCENVAFPRTHGIADLVRFLPARFRTLLPEEEQDRLTEYATVTRYPGDYEPITLREARHAVAMARLVRKQIRADYAGEIGSPPIKQRQRRRT
jgi:HEPN domain-containing protein